MFFYFAIYITLLSTLNKKILVLYQSRAGNFINCKVRTPVYAQAPQQVKIGVIKSNYYSIYDILVIHRKYNSLIMIHKRDGM